VSSAGPSTQPFIPSSGPATDPGIHRLLINTGQRGIAGYVDWPHTELCVGRQVLINMGETG
jgi:hypothetical protein